MEIQVLLYLPKQRMIFVLENDIKLEQSVFYIIMHQNRQSTLNYVRIIRNTRWVTHANS
jgi:hypothetical protein